DLMAIGAMACLHDQGISVPQQVSVAGFDDITMARFSSPLLTTYATPIVEVGERMCQLLCDRIDGLLPPARQQVLVYGELKVRKSTAPPTGESNAQPGTLPGRRIS
ncbi:MAG: LacI family DNA-binding transcriptional regulator, partial [Caldilineaceae bacterium]